LLHLKSKTWITVVLLATLFPHAANAFTVHIDFPGGSAEVLKLDADKGHLEISPSLHLDRGWPCWWFFRVDDAKPGSKLTLVVGPQQKPFTSERRLAAMWSLPKQPFISVDEVTWTQLDRGEIANSVGRYEVIVPASTFWLAWGPPFLPSHAETLLEQTVKKVTGAQRFELARTRQDRPVNGIRLGKPDGPAVWVQTRQHAWETGGSWVGKGFIDWVSSDDPAAVNLRKNAEVFFIPIMDIDNVTLGAGGKEATPRDHNRDWAAQPVYPEVAAAQTQIQKLAETGRLRVFLDLHNPGPSEPKPYFFGPLDYEQMEAERRQTYDRFLRLAVTHMTAPLAIEPKYLFATYVKTEEERARVSGAWVRARTSPNAIAMTLETAWNTPDSTAEGYMSVGRKLAITVAAFVAE